MTLKQHKWQPLRRLIWGYGLCAITYTMCMYKLLATCYRSIALPRLLFTLFITNMTNCKKNQVNHSFNYSGVQVPFWSKCRISCIWIIHACVTKYTGVGVGIRTVSAKMCIQTCTNCTWFLRFFDDWSGTTKFPRSNVPTFESWCLGSGVWTLDCRWNLGSWFVESPI